MSGLRLVPLALRMVVPQFCSASVMPAPARRIVECVKPAGRLLTSALIPCCHQVPDTGAAAASALLRCGQPTSRVGEGSVPATLATSQQSSKSPGGRAHASHFGLAEQWLQHSARVRFLMWSTSVFTEPGGLVTSVPDLASHAPTSPPLPQRAGPTGTSTKVVLARKLSKGEMTSDL